MTWGRQVAHVLRKDLAQLGWLVLLFLLSLGMITAAAAGWIGGPPGSGGNVPWVGRIPLLGGLAMLVVVLAIQADSPARSDAFWATRPLAPSAVLAAKLALIGLLLWLLPVAGQLAALLARGVEADRLPPLLGTSALTQAGTLAVFAVVAALTPDLRTFVLALAGAFIGWSLLEVSSAQLGGLGRSTYSLEGTAWRSAAWVVLGLGLLAHQYRTRNVRRGVLLTVLAAVVGVALPRALSPEQTPPLGTMPEVATDLDPGELSIEGVEVRPNPSMGSSEWWSLDVRLALRDAPPWHRVQLVQPRATLTLPDGRVEHPSTGQFLTPLVRPGVHEEGLDWIDEGRAAGRAPRWDGTAGIQLMIREAEARAISDGEGRLEISGLLEIARPRRLGSLPLERGAHLASGDVVYRVMAVRSTPRLLAVTGRSESIGGARDMWGSPFETIDVALVNGERGEALRLRGSGGGGVGQPLVLPGAHLRIHTLEHSADVDPRGGPAVDADWMRGAELLVHDWEVVGRTPVTVVTEDLRPSDPRPRIRGG